MECTGCWSVSCTSPGPARCSRSTAPTWTRSITPREGRNAPDHSGVPGPEHGGDEVVGGDVHLLPAGEQAVVDRPDEHVDGELVVDAGVELATCDTALQCRAHRTAAGLEVALLEGGDQRGVVVQVRDQAGQDAAR